MTLGSRVRELRSLYHYSQKELSDIVGVDASYISRIETGSATFPSMEVLRELARALHTTPEDLLASAGYTAKPSEAPSPEEAARILLEALERERLEHPILVPEASSPASAGPGAYVEAERWPYYPQPGERSHEFIAVPVIGDCLEPRIRPGERVIVDKSASPRPGDVVLAEHDGEFLIKILEIRKDGLRLVALQHQPPIPVNERTRIVGVVKMVMHRP